jgi:hypothetical protein
VVEALEIVNVWLPSVTWLLATPFSDVMLVPVVAEMSKVPAALATLTWLEVATLPDPLNLHRRVNRCQGPRRQIGSWRRRS